MATKVASTAFPVIPQDVADFFENDEFMGEARAIPHCQILNHEANFGFFVKEESMRRVGWTGPGKNLDHRFRTGSSEPGWFSRTPHLKVLARSPRFVEDRETKAILGNYDTPEGQAIRDMRGSEETSLRTLWLVYVCDEKGVRYHKIPLVLSVHGAAAARFGSMYEQWQQSIDDAYAAATGKSMVAAREQKVYALFTFSPTFDLEYVGEGQKSSPVAVVASFEPATAENFVDLVAQGIERDVLWSAREAYRNFDARFLKSCEKAFGFAVAPNLINPETGEISFGSLPAAQAVDGLDAKGSRSLR